MVESDCLFKFVHLPVCCVHLCCVCCVCVLECVSVALYKYTIVVYIVFLGGSIHALVMNADRATCAVRYISSLTVRRRRQPPRLQSSIHKIINIMHAVEYMALYLLRVYVCVVLCCVLLLCMNWAINWSNAGLSEINLFSA